MPLTDHEVGVLFCFIFLQETFCFNTLALLHVKSVLEQVVFVFLLVSLNVLNILLQEGCVVAVW